MRYLLLLLIRFIVYSLNQYRHRVVFLQTFLKVIPSLDVVLEELQNSDLSASVAVTKFKVKKFLLSLQGEGNPDRW